MLTNEKIAALRQEMKQRNIDAYIIPSADPHQSEYVAPIWKSRAWISGFTGSAGTVVITKDKACLWADSRYYTQAEKEISNSEFVLFKWGMIDVPFYPEWLAKEFADEITIGFDGALLSPSQVKVLKSKLKGRKVNFSYQEDLIDLVWKDRPTLPVNPVKELAVEHTGKSRSEKIANIRTKLAEKSLDSTLISSLDDVVWTLNIRGTDIAYNPIVISYLYISQDRVIYFADKVKFSKDILTSFENDEIELKSYDDIFAYCADITNEKIYLDPAKTSQKVYDLLIDNIIEEGRNFSTTMKSLKNEVELEGFRNAHIEDGVAMVKWLHWMSKNVGEIAMDEVSVADQLESFRAEGLNFQGLSFNSIIGYRGNGANPHYSAKKGACAEIKKERILLADSGGQYSGGTTDITRTFTLGNPTKDEKKNFTLVLKGMIQLSMAVFPKGTTGAQLDTFARMALWREGLNFGHGTGHGVGHYLCVHEGPQGVSPKSSSVALDLGMVISNEPGLYLVGEYGIRIENLIAVVPFVTRNEEFFTFETLTLCPIDLNLVAVELLTNEEKSWLNSYHNEVFEKVSYGLNDEEKSWLKENTRQI